MADVVQRALDPRAAPRRILRRHAHHEALNLEQHAATTRPVGVGPLPGDQLTVPPQQRIRRRDRGDLPQSRTADSVRSCGQPTAIVVRETQPMPTKLTPQKPVFFNQVRDRLPLPAVQPAGQHAQHHLQRRGTDHEAQLISRAGRRNVGRAVEHYALRWTETDGLSRLHAGRCRSVPLT